MLHSTSSTLVVDEDFTVTSTSIPWLVAAEEDHHHNDYYNLHHHDVHHRNLAGAYGAQLDYTVLSVGVMTLALLLGVELFRHHMDHLAHGRPFFTSVLDGVYSELATLGIVEMFIWILHNYWKDMNVAREMVFAGVHFALFYTALFNAFQSCVLAVLSSQISTKAWVVTEHLELDHYVELREEFDRVQTKLRKGGVCDDIDEEAGFFDVFSVKGIQRALRGMKLRIRYPRLRAKYTNLLVQIRFHQMRLHLLEGNDLPVTLKVSTYLKKAEQSVWIKLVHVSTFAWLFLTGSLNTIYFLMGMVAYITEDEVIVGKSLTYIFFSCMIAFILISLVVYNKMKVIFTKIINMKQAVKSDIEAFEKGRKKQLSFFWLGDPKLVIAMIQFMQFGYALALAILLVYWKDIDHTVDPLAYLAAVVVCYSIFLMVMARVIPQYTLCTSLGYLVNEKQLQETVAAFRLEEAQRRRKRILADRSAYADIDSGSVVIFEDPGEKQTMDKPPPNNENEETTSRTTSESSALPPLTIRLNKPSHNKEQGEEETKTKMNAPKTQLLAELVKMDTMSLRQAVPKAPPTEKKSREEILRERRRNRKKSVSDGVALMRALGHHSSSAAEDALKGSDFFKPPPAASADFFNPPPPPAATPSKAAEAPVRSKDDTAIVKNDATTRRERRKNKRAISASAVIQSWQDFSVIDPAPQTSPSLDAPPSPVARLFGGTMARQGSRSREVTPKSGALHPLMEHHEEHTDHEEHTEVGSPNPEVSGNFIIESVPPLPMIPVLEKDGEVSGNFIVDNMPPPPVMPVLSDNTGNNDNDDDGISIATSKSVGNQSIDELSDVSVDVPESEHGALAAVTYTKPPWTESWAHSLSPPVFKSNLRIYLAGKRYVSIDHVIGTLFCFYLVGSRVEVLLHGSEIVPAGDQSIVFKSHYSFWAEVMWHVAFLSGAVAIIVLFPKHMQEGNIKLRARVLSAWIDVLITGACLSLLFVAESQRCCDADDNEKYYSDYDNYDDPHRKLAAEDGYGEYSDEYDEYGSWYDKWVNDTGDCCPMWGRRGYGGLGNIEPFTSLIFLRVVRFSVAKYVVGKLDKMKLKKKSDDTATEEVDNEKSPIRAMLFGEKSTERNHHPMKDEKGTALELWEHAVRKYPDVVAKYGEFSGELFQVMLGLPLIEGATSKAVRDDHTNIGSENITVAEEEAQAAEDALAQKPETKGTHKRVRSVGQSFMLAGKQYESLPVEAQEIIMAGKLGKPVSCASTRNLASLIDDSNLPALHEHEEDGHDADLPSGPTKFEINEDQLAQEAEAEHHGFIAPNARLVRSMRRCDRRLVPLLTKWVSVDVAMTQFEVVYFEAEDLDGDDATDPVKASTRLAMTATKGGKGLRLCDVAYGRKVVGHLDLSEITELHVERDMPVADLSLLNYIDDEERVGGNSKLKAEYWTDETAKPNSPTSVTNGSRNIRWAKIKEDRLKLTSIHGTLVLRFYSDLDDTESHLERSTQENEAEGPLRKNISFQWVQTIGRFCGSDQLKQSLPHFGDNTSEELRDYLVVVHYHDKEAGEAQKKSHIRRKSSFGGSAHGGSAPVTDRASSDQGNRKSFHRSRHSFGGEEPPSETKRKTLHRASHSFGGETSRAVDESVSSRKLFDFSQVPSSASAIEEEDPEHV